jgi:tricorn protease-like protein/C-terminal processing protease CtpA/Prc
MSIPSLAVAAALVAVNPTVQAANASRGLCRYPDVSRDSIVFVYGNDLWLVPKTGGTARPVASPAGFEGSPRFSPDGQTIAFRGNYDQALDLYTIPAAGGIPERVTHHPAPEGLCDWTPDGKGLVFMTGAIEGLDRAQKLYTIPSTGGLPMKLPVPYGTNGAINRTGEWLAYTPHSTDNRTWKRYRGGMATDVWLMNLKTGESLRITDWEGTDTLPMWHGNKVFYLSDRGATQGHVLNVWSYDLDSRKTAQVTTLDTHDVRWPAIGPDDAGNGEMVFQHGDRIMLLNLGSGIASAVNIEVPGDRESLRTTTVDAAGSIQDASIAPSGKRVAVVGRGDIWSAPAENGTPRNLTRTDGIFERSASWSPNGKTIAFFSDATGEYELWTMPADGKGEARQVTKGGTCFRTGITWAPNSKHVVITDKTGAIDLVKLEDGSVRRIDRDPEARSIGVSFSHDSRWMAWARSADDSEMEVIFLFDTTAEGAKPLQVTSGYFNDGDPVFDRKGQWLAYTSQRNFAPTYSEFDTTWIYGSSQALMAVPLKKDMPLAWLPKSDEEGQKDEAKPAAGGDAPAAAPSGDGSRQAGPPQGGRRRRGAEQPEFDFSVDDDPGDEDDKKDDDKKDDDKKDDDTPDDDEKAPAGPGGSWKGTATIAGGEAVEFTLELTVAEDNTVKASCVTKDGTIELTGTWDPGTKVMKLRGTMNGLTYEAEITIDGDSLRGSASTTAPDGTSTKIELTATRTKRDGQAAPARGDGKPEPTRVEIDLDGFEARAVELPVPKGSFGSLGFNDRNELLFGRDGSVRLLELNEAKPTEKAGPAGTRFDVSADGKKLLMGGRGGASIAAASAGATPKPIVSSPMLVAVDPRDEHRQILADCYRIMRDWFYDEGMHGVDWKAIHDRYAGMLTSVVTREDLNYLISEMISELNVGHAYLRGPGDVEESPIRSVGMLGVDFATATLEDGSPAKAWKLARFPSGGPFDSEARSPLAMQGLGIAEGDYLLAVNGVPVDTSKDPWAPFVGLAGKSTVLTISKKPLMDESAKDIVVTPMGSESGLRYRAWVESKRKRVEELSGGRVGYIYVPNTGVDGQNELVRGFYGQRMKPALLIDERWNGGGQIPTRFIELLNRPVTNYWARRDARDGAWPPDGHRGPKAMLINGLAGSGGDMFPWLFKANKIGPTIGTRTWGGLVGISGNPSFIDGGSISAPTFGFYEIDGTWGVEGHGVDPDIEVLDDPALMKDGGDPQLEKAVQVLLKELESGAWKPVPQPKGPDRRGMGLPKSDR